MFNSCWDFVEKAPIYLLVQHFWRGILNIVLRAECSDERSSETLPNDSIKVGHERLA